MLFAVESSPAASQHSNKTKKTSALKSPCGGEEAAAECEVSQGISHETSTGGPITRVAPVAADGEKFRQGGWWGCSLNEMARRMNVECAPWMVSGRKKVFKKPDLCAERSSAKNELVTSMNWWERFMLNQMQQWRVSHTRVHCFNVELANSYQLAISTVLLPSCIYYVFSD